MDALKKYLGIVWMIAGPALVVFMVWQAADKISSATGLTRTNTILQWTIILLVFIPVCAGLVLFGYYAWRGEYDRLPEDSTELEK